MDAVLQDMLRVRDMHNTASSANADNNALDTASATRSTANLEAPTEHEYALDHQTDDISDALVAPPRGNGEAVCGKVAVFTSDRVLFEWHSLDNDDLDYTHSLGTTITFTDPPDWTRVGLDVGDLVVNASLSILLTLYRLWRTNELRELAHAHEIRLRARETTSSLLEKLDLHKCGRKCPSVVVSFRRLYRPRQETQVERARAAFREATLTTSNSYTEVASEELRRSIIREWQEAFSTDKFQTSTCGPCGRRTLSSGIISTSPSDFDLTLLRNDNLPRKVLPTTYNLAAYHGAILAPKGLLNRQELGNILMCEACHRELVQKQRMPRLSLANSMYYAHDELPQPAKAAFAQSTFTERLLIPRARCSRISYRFSQARKSEFDGVGSDPDYSIAEERDPRSQRYIKGNVLVMPQNSTHLNTVLPPPPETVRDTVCAVFVGKTKPTKETIGKLGPLLVKKSRVITIIDFLVADNPHYACDTEFHGFNQRNLDELFGPGMETQDEGIPCALDIGFIEDSDAIRSSTADYTGRNDCEVDPPATEDGLLMDNVGYTMGDEAPVSYRDMKMKALSHCLAGGQFIRSQGGERFIPDFENPNLLTWLFPHLDPWGIGGFHEPTRAIPIGMQEQLKYLLELDDNRFERDPNFAFVYYNILQKKAVCDSVRFRVKVADQSRIVRELLSVDRPELERLIASFKANPRYEPQSDKETRMVSLVNKVGTMLHDLPGTAGYKLKMRNEIWALVNKHGTPAFFITLNPSDINHPLVRLFAGDNIRLEDLESGQELRHWERMRLVARNPAACAKFFHEMLTKFIHIVLRFGRNEKGLLGKCTAYYGTVEAQGRGTLHCHMLIWLQGHPSPQQMRDMMLSSNQYQSDLFTWLESLIKCELLGTSSTVEDSDPGRAQRPKLWKLPDYVHPGTNLGPSVANTPEQQFDMRFASDVNDIVTNTNWHEHTDTCWKYLARGEPRTDENCRMRIDGATRQETSVEEETGSVLLRRLHPRIASYNDLIIFLIRANMEIKHIGSGQRAKALMYYITDYITKASLPAHIGLAALLYAINRSHEKFSDIPNWEETKQAGALTIVVNSLMARQEVSHQQVMSYLVGGGDHYKSERFRILHHGTFERLVKRYWILDTADIPANNSATDESQEQPASLAQSSPDEEDGRTTNVTTDCLESLRREDDSVTLVLGAGSISAVNQQQDYLYRPLDEPFDSMGLYEYIGLTEKVTKSAEDRRILSRRNEPSERRTRGRPEEPRGEFSPEHPQYETHVVRKRTVWVIPVILGDRIPRPDRGVDEREDWARTIITLFVPWRHPQDLKDENETWSSAYERHAESIPPEHMTIIHNMNVLSECKDVRDEATLARKLKNHTLPHAMNAPTAPDPFDIYAEPDTPNQEIGNSAGHQEDENPQSSTLLRELDNHMGTRFRHAIDEYFTGKPLPARVSESYGAPILLTQDKRSELVADRATMRKLKRKRCPDHNDHEHVQDFDRNTRPRWNPPAILDTIRLGNTSSSQQSSTHTGTAYDPMDVAYQVILEKNLRSNPEQLRAFEIVARQVIHGGPQLMMYVGGVGGTGKSHVVNSILRLFHLLGKSKNILVAAPTGAAALLIGGHTIHSLTLLPDGPGRDLQDLTKIWEGVDYLILDEISMVGATFLSQLNSRLQRAKGHEDTSSDVPFGGLNIIFTGDFGQLRPVRDPPLYHHNLVENPGLQNCEFKRNISALMGVYLWRLVNKVVLLKINQRQAGDKAYADLLGRIRVGEVIKHNTTDLASDFDTLKTRYADRSESDPATIAKLADAPIIVGKKKIRDLLNLRAIGHHARHISGEVHLYNARDKIGGQPATEDDKRVLLQLSSTVTHDSLGKLPLFPGMKVMVQENIAFTNGVVNGTEGTVADIIYEEENGRRYPVVVYVHIPGSGNVCANATDDIVPIFPETTTFTWSRQIAGVTRKVNVSRLQVPLLPAYAYTDYKSQGRSLDAAIVDPASAGTLQGIYVMLSRVRELKGLCILWPFKACKIEQRLSQELRTELARLQTLDDDTRNTHPSMYAPAQQ